MIKTPEEMLELINKGENITTPELMEYTDAVIEFAPYAAEWMIEAKKLLWKSRIQLSRNAVDLGDSGFFDDEDDTRKLCKEIDKFLESRNDT